MTDLLERCAELVAIPSVSHHEDLMADHIEARLAAAPWLEVVRVGRNVVARTDQGRRPRLILAGHTDTVPPAGNASPRIEGDTLWGLGSADMKAGLAVSLELATSVAEPAVDVTYVFYAGEEVEARFNGLRLLLAERPDLLAGDAAVLGEPTGGRVEAGCQGTMRVAVRLGGTRAHTARPWMGRNAVHRLAGVLTRLEGYDGRRPVIDGCEFREAMQAVAVVGGVAGNVVPDRAEVSVNHRFAPDRTPEQALDQVRSVLAPALDPSLGDGVELVDVAPGARPALDHPLLARLVASTAHAPRAKLGWTDVSFFAAAGIPATNFGPGDPTLAHTAGERVDRASLEAVHATLHGLLAPG